MSTASIPTPARMRAMMVSLRVAPLGSGSVPGVAVVDGPAGGV